MMLPVRTTLTIDDDLAGILRRKARELDQPFKEVLNSTLRKGLAEKLPETKHDVTVRPHDFGRTRPSLDLDRFNQMADELAVEDYQKKAIQDDISGH